MRAGFTWSLRRAQPSTVLEAIRAHLRHGQQIFVGVTDPIDPAVETPEQVRDRVVRSG
jgi:5-methyltetrahydropteroyltriglutamate--homocysteine methyltransferase